MTKAVRHFCPPPEADGPYKYFMIGGVNPVRVMCDERGRYVGAETTDPENGGEMKIAHTLLGRIMKDELDVAELTKQEFLEMCRSDQRRYRQKQT